MTQYDMKPNKVPTHPAAILKEWQAKVTYRECGVVTDIQTYAVTLGHKDGIYAATVDGELVSVHDAARILKSAENDGGLTLTREIRSISPAMKACLGVSA